MPGPRGRRGFREKPKDFKGTFKRMLKDFKEDKKLIFVVILLSILSAVLSIFSPVLVKNLLSDDSLSEMFEFSQNASLDSGSFLIHWDKFRYAFGIILMIYIGSAILNFGSSYISNIIGGKYAYRMRKEVQLKIDRLPLSYFDRVPYGDTLSVGTNDVDNISRNVQTIITQVFSSITTFFGSLIAMFITDYRLAFVAIASLPFTLVFILIFGKISGKQYVKYRYELGELNGKIEEDYSGFKIIKLFNKEQDIIESFNISNEKMEKSDRKSQFYSGLIFPITHFINNVAYVGIAVVAGVVSDGATMIAFFLFLDLFTKPLRQLSQIASTFYSVTASGERIYLLLDEVEIEKDKEDAIDNEKEIKGDFKFDNVYFQYLFEKPLIGNFSLTINAGDSVAIVGPTGAGKTTMVNLIMRFYELTNTKDLNSIKKSTTEIVNKLNKDYLIDSNLNWDDLNIEIDENIEKTIQNSIIFIQNYKEKLENDCNKKDEVNYEDINLIMDTLSNHLNNGDIYLDGKSIKDYKVDTLRGSIGMVLQDTWLFKGTIKDNLLYGDQNATDEEIINALKEVNIYHFVMSLPNGLDYVLEEDGTNISQGQRQLLTIARAIISKPKILILDEATSSVDTRTEKQIQDSLDNLAKKRTSFIIAHRLSTIKNAKTIIVMKKGHIVEVGNHEELLKKNGFYADLYNSQFNGVNPMEKKEDVLES